MTEIKADLLYTKTHEWLRIEGDVVTIGVTDYAQEQLTDIVYVEDLPDQDDELDTGDPICVLNSVKSASEVYSPVGGVVLEANETLEDEPELINSSPYEDGWIVKIKAPGVKASDFLTSEAYGAHVESQKS